MFNKRNRFVLSCILSLVLALFISCSNGMNDKENKTSQITLQFSDAYFQRLLGKKASRMVSVPTSEKFLVWTTVKDNITKEIVTETYALNALKYGVYDFEFGLYYITGNEINKLQEQVQDALIASGLDLDAEENEILEIQNKVLKDYFHNAKPVYYDNVQEYVINNEDASIVVNFKKNQNYIPLKSSSNLKYLFIYENSYEVEEVNAKLYTLNNYLSGKNNPTECVIKNVTAADIEEFGENASIINNDNITVKMISMELPSEVYYLEIEVKQNGIEKSSFCGEVLKLELGLDYATFYQSRNGHVYLPLNEIVEPPVENPVFSAFSNDETKGIKIIAETFKNADRVQCFIKPFSEENPNMPIEEQVFNKFLRFEDNTQVQFYFPTPIIETEYRCYLNYYNGDEIIHACSIDVEALSTLYSTYSTYNSENSYEIYFDFDNESIIISNFDFDELFWNKAPGVIVADPKINAKIKTYNIMNELSEIPIDLPGKEISTSISGLNDIVYTKEELGDLCIKLNNKRCQLSLSYSFIAEHTENVSIFMGDETTEFTPTYSFNSDLLFKEYEGSYYYTNTESICLTFDNSYNCKIDLLEVISGDYSITTTFINNIPDPITYNYPMNATELTVNIYYDGIQIPKTIQINVTEEDLNNVNNLISLDKLSVTKSISTNSQLNFSSGYQDFTLKLSLSDVNIGEDTSINQIICSAGLADENSLNNEFYFKLYSGDDASNCNTLVSTIPLNNDNLSAITGSGVSLRNFMHAGDFFFDSNKYYKIEMYSKYIFISDTSKGMSNDTLYYLQIRGAIPQQDITTCVCKELVSASVKYMDN